MKIFLFFFAFVVALSSCRSSHHERTQSIQASRSDTAHFVRLLATSSDSITVLTVLAADSFEVQLNGASVYDTAAVSPPCWGRLEGAVKLVGANLRIVRAETRSARTTHDSVRASSETSETASGTEVSDKPPDNRAVHWAWLACGLALLLILAFFFIRFAKQHTFFSK